MWQQGHAVLVLCLALGVSAVESAGWSSPLAWLWNTFCAVFVCGLALASHRESSQRGGGRINVRRRERFQSIQITHLIHTKDCWFIAADGTLSSPWTAYLTDGFWWLFFIGIFSQTNKCIFGFLFFFFEEWRSLSCKCLTLPRATLFFTFFIIHIFFTRL